MKLFGQNTTARISNRPAAQQDDRVTARWLREANHDQRGELAADVARSPGFGRVYLRMRHLGEELRQEALANMTGLALDPQLAHTERIALLRGAMRHLSIDPVPEPLMTTSTPDEIAFATRLPYAWLQTFNREPRALRTPRPQMRIAQAQHIPREAQMWDMACVLGRYVKDLPMYAEGLADYIYPPDPRQDQTLTPLLHVFARALLLPHYTWECPSFAQCRCLSTIYAMQRTPEGLLPEPTLELDTGALKREIRRQTDQQLKGGEALTPKPYAPRPAGQPTPPSGTHWEQMRRQTNKKLDGLGD